MNNPERVQQFGMAIGDEFVGADADKWMDIVNPATGETWASVPAAEEVDVDRAVKAAARAFRNPAWREITPMARAELLHRLGERVQQEAGRLAELETRANGKIIRETTAQMNVIPNWFHYFAGTADKIFGETIPFEKTTVLNYTLREPLGVVAMIVPWNSPLLLAAWKLAPALAAGNTVVLKPSDTTPITALELARLMNEVGFPNGVLNVITGYGPQAGAALVSQAGVAKVSFTGGTETARAIVRGTAQNLARLTLELGGKSPNIVFEDAPIEAAVNGVISGILRRPAKRALPAQDCSPTCRYMMISSPGLLIARSASNLAIPLTGRRRWAPRQRRPNSTRFAGMSSSASTKVRRSRGAEMNPTTPH